MTSEHRTFTSCLAVSTLMMTTTLFFNGELNTTQAALADSTRDWATLVQTVEMVTLALVARHAPRAVNPFPLTAAAAACAVVGASLAGVGMGAGSPALLTVGVCLTSSSTAWASILWIVLCSALRFRSMLVCFVGGDLLAIPLALALSCGGYPFVLACYAAAIVAVLAFCGPRTRDAFAEFARAEAAVDAQVTRPRAILPLAHNLFVYIFAFSLAYGFAMRYEHASGGLLTHWFIAATLAGIVVYALSSKAGPRADTLFNLASALLVVGFLLVLLDDERLALPASVSLLCSETVFCELMSLSLCAIAARNRSNVLSAIAWGYAAYFAGIEAGAQLGLAVTALSADAGLASRSMVAAVLGSIVLYTLLSIRDFGFDKTIAAVEPEPEGQPETPVEIRYTDRVEARCDELVAQLGLTEREADVFRLLARGNNTLRIQEELAITKNTLKYHARHIYEKAGVHSQQELIDLL